MKRALEGDDEADIADNADNAYGSGHGLFPAAKKQRANAGDAEEDENEDDAVLALSPLMPRGSYHDYYMRRYQNLPLGCPDARLQLLDPAWFKHRRCLDIGCNAGLLTIDVAKRFQPQYIHGIDLDEQLVKYGRFNLRTEHSCRGSGSAESFPASHPLCLGTVPFTPTHGGFPNNIHFSCLNFLECANHSKLNMLDYHVVLAYRQ